MVLINGWLIVDDEVSIKSETFSRPCSKRRVGDYANQENFVAAKQRTKILEVGEDYDKSYTRGSEDDLQYIIWVRKHEVEEDDDSCTVIDADVGCKDEYFIVDDEIEVKLKNFHVSVGKVSTVSDQIVLCEFREEFGAGIVLPSPVAPKVCTRNFKTRKKKKKKRPRYSVPKPENFHAILMLTHDMCANFKGSHDPHSDSRLINSRLKIIRWTLASPQDLFARTINPGSVYSVNSSRNFKPKYKAAHTVLVCPQGLYASAKDPGDVHSVSKVQDLQPATAHTIHKSSLPVSQDLCEHIYGSGTVVLDKLGKANLKPLTNHAIRNPRLPVTQDSCELANSLGEAYVSTVVSVGISPPPKEVHAILNSDATSQELCEQPNSQERRTQNEEDEEERNKETSFLFPAGLSGLDVVYKEGPPIFNLIITVSRLGGIPKRSLSNLGGTRKQEQSKAKDAHETEMSNQLSAEDVVSVDTLPVFYLIITVSRLGSIPRRTLSIVGRRRDQELKNAHEIANSSRTSGTDPVFKEKPPSELKPLNPYSVSPRQHGSLFLKRSYSISGCTRVQDKVVRV